MSDQSFLDEAQARDFLLQLHGRGVGQGDLVLYASRDSRRSRVRSQVGCELSPEGGLLPVNAAPDAADLGQLVQRLQLDVYVSVCRFDPARQGVGMRNSRRQADACWCPAVTADLDVKAEDETAVRTVEEMKRFLAVLEDHASPSMVVETGSGGVHAYWLLQTPLVDMPRAKRLRRCWIAYLNGLASSVLGRTIEFDAVGDLSRVLRVPGTTRWPKRVGGEPCPVVLSLAEGPIWAAETLESLLSGDALASYDRSGVVGRMAGRVDVNDPELQGRVERMVEAARQDVLHATRRNEQLNRSAYTLAGFGAWGLLEVEVAYEALVNDACRANGLLEEDGGGQCDATFLSGWEAGLLHPMVLDRHPEAPCLPETFWERREWHRYIRDLARARCVSPDALLGAALAQVALRTSYKVTLPGIIGGPAPLNVLHTIAIESGMGKGAATAVAGQTFGGAVEPLLRTVVLGSGEGMAHAYYADVQVEDTKTGKVKTVSQRFYEGVLFDVDEGESLIRLLQRSGQTTGEDLRSGWSGKRLGRFYADRDKRKEVEPMSYRLVMLMGIQPRAAGPLLDQDAGGLPQRVLWFTGYDLDAPDEAAEPPFVPWVAPALSEPLEVDPAIWAEVRAHHKARQRREVTVERFDHHRNLVKLKTAALLAILDGRGIVTGEDWELAELVVATSDRVRASMLQDIGQDSRDRQRAVDSVYVNRAQKVRRAGDATVRVAQGITRRVKAANSMTRSDIRRNTTGRDRKFVTDALEHACAQGWIQELEDGVYGPS